MNENKSPERIDATAIVLELLKDVIERLDALNGNYGKKGSWGPRSGNGTSLVIVTLLLGVLIGALIALLLSGCIDGGLAPVLGLGAVLGPGQIKLVRREFYTLMIDRNETIKPMDGSAAREALTLMGYTKVGERNEQGYDCEIWELPKNKHTT